MADEPENLTLKLLREMRAEQERLASMLGKVTDVVTQIAATQDHHGQALERHSAILEHHSKVLDHHSDILERHSAMLGNHSSLLEKISETQANQGARLNAIDGRLALIEKHTGMVKA
jgi:hypothetical protein